MWIYFTDKGDNVNRFFSNPELIVSKESLERRKKVLPPNNLIDYDDLPVNEEYVNVIKNKVIEIKHRSRWFNAISVIIDKQNINELTLLPFVKKSRIGRKI